MKSIYCFCVCTCCLLVNLNKMQAVGVAKANKLIKVTLKEILSS